MENQDLIMAKAELDVAKAEARKAKREAKKRADSNERLAKIEAYRQKAIDDATKAREEKEAKESERRQLQIQRKLEWAESREVDVDEMHDFYDATIDNNGELQISINNLKTINMLRRLGFYRYDQPDGSHAYVYIKDNKIELIKDKETIVDRFEDYIMQLPEREMLIEKKISSNDSVQVKQRVWPELLKEKLYKNLQYYFSTTLPRLRPLGLDGEVKEISIVHDTKNSKYFFFKNVALRVTAEGIEEIAYENFLHRLDEIGEDNGRYIWTSDIIQRDWNGDRCEIASFYTFMSYISGMYEGSIHNTKDAYERLRNLQCLLGYLMHDNYETNLKAILLTDEEQIQGMPSGGTGKGIIGKALSAMMNPTISDVKYIAVPGKDFDTTKDTRYGIGNITTKLAHVEDAKKNLDFVALFGDVTDGAIFRKLHHDATKHMIKIMISTNSGLDLSAPSFKRRLVFFELCNYFNADRTPDDEFGFRFFESSWPIEEWESFDVLMVKCVQMYLQNGIKQLSSSNYARNIVADKLRPEFINWFEAYIHDGYTSMQETSYSLDKMWHNFRTIKNSQYVDIFNVRNSFTSSIKLWLRAYGIKSGIVRSTDDLLVIYPNSDTKLNEVIFK